MRWSGLLVSRALLTAVLAAPLPAVAQSATAADDAPIQIGPVALAPSIRLTNIGHDSNVYHQADDPASDVTATASPSARAWLRLPALRVSGRSQVDFIYFQRLTDLRAIDSDSAARVEVPLNWLMPYVEGNRALTRHQRNLEIDAPVKRLNESQRAGVDVRVTGKFTVGVTAQRSRVGYSGDTFYYGSDLAELLNRRSQGEGVRLRYAVTPLTSVGVTAERQRDRFDSAVERDANSVWVMPEVEFQPFALLNGRAQVGFRRRSFVNTQIPDFGGTVARVDLRYTLLGRTQFGFGVERDLEYSYRFEQEEYLLSGVRVSVNHKLAEPWDVGLYLGRFQLDYRLVGSVDRALADAGGSVETYVSVGAGVGYRMGGSRLALQMDYDDRDSTVSTFRYYQRFRITSSLSHDF
jgi:hypothetical protein